MLDNCAGQRNKEIRIKTFLNEEEQAHKHGSYTSNATLSNDQYKSFKGSHQYKKKNNFNDKFMKRFL